MAISFSCECGKRLKVADTLLGKKVKCPDCQKVTVVTAEAASAPAKPVAAKPKPANKRPAPVDDDSDLSDLLGDEEPAPKPAAKKKPTKPAADDEPDLSSLLDDDDDTPPPAKKKSGKPALGEDLEPDLSSLLGDDDDDAPPVKKKSKAAADDDDFMSSLEDDEDPVPVKKSKKPILDEDDEQEDAGDEDAVPAKKKPVPPKKSSKLLMIILILVVLLIGAGAAVFFLFPEWVGLAPPPPQKINPPPQLKQLPPMPNPITTDKKDGAKDSPGKKDDAKKDDGNKDDAKKDDSKKDDAKKDDAKKDNGKKDDPKKDNDSKEDKKDPDKKVSKEANPTEKEIENAIGMKLVRIEPGKFAMGSPPDEKEREPVEESHAVEITQPFYLGKFEVTQDEFMKIMNSNPSKFKGDKLPVESISWDEAKEFCAKLSEKDGRTYTLPTEAEWEYACRAGGKTPFSFGDTIATDQANYNGNFIYNGGKPGEFREKTTDVGTFKPNAWGLYDMHGNVAEWCEDRYGKDYYKAGAAKDPQGFPFGEFRCVRGGSWIIGPASCRSAFRFNEQPNRGDETLGFRVVLRLPKAAVKEETKKDDEEPKKDKEEPKKEKNAPKKEDRDKKETSQKSPINLFQLASISGGEGHEIFRDPHRGRVFWNYRRFSSR
jgi:formylglycine-generating enzyme required for sulfatase activity